MKKKAFTLIELIAVLVILAILALIVTPLVMNIIRKAKVSADKRSVDAYGRSVELAIANYLLDEGKFPTSIDELTIEYSGDKVVCETTNLNSDSSVYLAGCTVGGRSVDYTYGSEEAITYDYEVGDEVIYNNVDYYVIKDVKSTDTAVTLLKKTPLTTDEVNLYGGVGTENNHVNINTFNFAGAAQDINGYGYAAFYSTNGCGPRSYGGVNFDYCKTNYEESDIKYIVDKWALAKIPSGLEEARLITMNDLTNSLGMNFITVNATFIKLEQTEDSPMWVFGSDYSYWTMTPVNDTNRLVYTILSSGISTNQVNGGYGGDHAVRPVITIKKSVLSS